MLRSRAVVPLVVFSVLVGCGAAATPDALSENVLRDHGIEPAGATTTKRIVVWDGTDEGMPWELYLAASKLVGLDFSPYKGRRAEVRTTPIDGWAPDMRAFVLVIDGVVIGAWTASEDVARGGSTIYSLDRRAVP